MRERKSTLLLSVLSLFRISSLSDVLKIVKIPYCRRDESSSLISTCCFAHYLILPVYRMKVLSMLYFIEIKFQVVDKHLSALPRASLDQALLSC